MGIVSEYCKKISEFL
ncbi:hypothetical protein VCHC55C2_1224A, partial [Vibrio cholerae HC-55C2]